MNNGRMGELMLVLCLLAWALFIQLAGPVYCETMDDLRVCTGAGIVLLLVASLLSVVSLARKT